MISDLHTTSSDHRGGSIQMSGEMIAFLIKGMIPIVSTLSVPLLLALLHTRSLKLSVLVWSPGVG